MGGEPYQSAPPPQDPGAASHSPADGAAPGFEYWYGSPAPDGAAPPSPAPPRRSRRGVLIGVLSAVVVLALLGGGVSWYVLNLPQPEETAEAYAEAWNERDYAAMAALSTDPALEEVLGGIDANLGVEEVRVQIGGLVRDGDTAAVPYEVSLSLANASDWGYDGRIPLVRADGDWLVEFSPAVAHPGLEEGQTLARTTTWGERGRILAADGSRLDTEDATGSVQMLTGGVGTAEEEDLERLGPAYQVGDPAGTSGLQRAYEAHLAGEAATSILLVAQEEAEDPAGLSAEEANTLATLDGADGQDLQTSIDPGIQRAASAAIVNSSDPAALVAVRPSTGEILAAVNVPGGFNRAFEGQYAPGSSFKIISYAALLGNGLSAEAVMDCPEEADVGGWPFVNAGGAEYGEQTVAEAFATSCNTALVQEVERRLDSQSLTATTELFGMNAALDLGLPTLEPSFPAPQNTTMLAAQSIGQGQVLTSPLHMATVPAAVADGSWRHPVLVTEPRADGLPEPRQVPGAQALRPMMRAVITDGTAKDAGFTGEVYGKTGSAEYGSLDDLEDEDDELPTHAWMVGYKGDVAFAVLVEGGGGGGSVAGPLAAAFANAL